jgi:hypothetical protein
MANGGEGVENGRFKHKKTIFVLKFKINIHWSNVYALLRSFVKF